MARQTKNTVPITEQRPFQAVADFLLPIVGYWKVDHPGYQQKLAAQAMKIGSGAKLSNIQLGKDLPTPEECLALAHYFDFPVEDLLRIAGYPIVRDLLAFAQTLNPQTDAGKYDKDFMIKYLRMALEQDWQRMPWASPWKANAEIILTRRDASLYAKARGYAEQVRGWHLDNEGVARSEEFSHLALPAVS